MPLQLQDGSCRTCQRRPVGSPPDRTARSTGLDDRDERYDRTDRLERNGKMDHRKHPMQEVVTRGTGKKARIPGYHVFGKTGTAQCLSPDGGYVHGKYISSFVCGAPAESPRLLALVVVNQSSVGGETFVAGQSRGNACRGEHFTPIAGLFADLTRRSSVASRSKLEKRRPRRSDPSRKELIPPLAVSVGIHFENPSFTHRGDSRSSTISYPHERLSIVDDCGQTVDQGR